MPTPIQQLPRASLIALMMAVVTNAAVAQDSASGPDTLSETYRDWIVGCRTVASQGNQPGARLCEMTQELRQQDGGQRVLYMALRREEEAGEGFLTMVTPFGLNDTDQVAIEIDGATVLRAPFQTCLPEGCIVQSQLGPDGIEVMRSDADATVALPTTSGALFQVTISLRGFSAAWNRLSEF